MNNKFKSDFLNILQQKGLLYQCTNLEGLDELMSEKKIVAYLGMDCTAPSIHIGNLVPLIVMRVLQQCGHKPIMLLGGATTKIGDPTGKDEARHLMPEEEIENNLANIKRIFDKFIKFDNGSPNAHFSDALFVNNADWISKLNYIDFLRDIGPYFSVNRMLSFESVKARLAREQHMSFLEFNYMIMQSYDFYYLNREYGCKLQVCGADQWGNVIGGVELTRRLNFAKHNSSEEVFGLSSPLLLKPDGAKMGKTAGGLTVWLDENFLPVYDYFQYFRNVDDSMVGKMLRTFTELPLSRIEELEKLEGEELNEAKKILAFEATKMCHGEEKAVLARDKAVKVFEQGENIGNLPIKEIQFSDDELRDGKPLFIVLRDVQACKSGGEAKRLIKGGAVKINDELIEDEEYLVSEKDFIKDDTEINGHVNVSEIKGQFKLSVGKKNYLRVVVK